LTPFALVGAVIVGTLSVAAGSSSPNSGVGRIAEGAVPFEQAALMEKYGHMCRN